MCLFPVLATSKRSWVDLRDGQWRVSLFKDEKGQAIQY